MISISQPESEIEKLRNLLITSPKKLKLKIPIESFFSYPITPFQSSYTSKQKHITYSHYNKIVSNITTKYPDVKLLRMCHNTGLLINKPEPSLSSLISSDSVEKKDLLTDEVRQLEEESTDYIFIRFSRRRSLRFPSKDALLSYLEDRISYGAECKTIINKSIRTIIRTHKFTENKNEWGVVSSSNVLKYCLSIKMRLAGGECIDILSNNSAFITALYGNHHNKIKMPDFISDDLTDDYKYLLKFHSLIKRTLMPLIINNQQNLCVKYCKSPHCSGNDGFLVTKPSFQDILVTSKNNTKISCPGFVHGFLKCDKLYCQKCDNYYHDNDLCDVILTPEEYDSIREIHRISKKCPYCDTSIEKNDGCNHMTCGNCKQHFCWSCMTKFNESIQWEEHINQNGENCLLF